MPDPRFVPAPWWRRGNRFNAKPIPVCPKGHNLQTETLGNLIELSITLAFLRGFLISSLALTIGMLEDARSALKEYPHFGLMGMTGFALGLGLIAASKAWDWAGMTGPVHRLTSRALGTALGYLLPAILASHALYFHWADSLQAAFVAGLLELVQVIQQLHDRVG